MTTTFESISKVLEEQFNNNMVYSARSFGTEFARRIYDSVFKWIIGVAEFPKCIIRLDEYLMGLEEFSKNKYYQAVVAFACLEGLARRRHDVLKGEWEKVTWIIIKYADNFSSIWNLMIDKDVEIASKDWLVKFSSPKLFPNPCLRLEFLRFLSSFNIGSVGESFCASLITTICELHDNHSRLIVDQVPMCSAKDVTHVIRNNHIEIQNILDRDHPDSKRTNIIMAVVKLTKMLAMLEIERLSIFNSPLISPDDLRNGSQWKIKFLRIRLNLYYLSFCGLLWQDDDSSGGASSIYDLTEFVKILSNNCIMREYVVDTLKVITNASLSLNNMDEVLYDHSIITQKRDNILRHLLSVETSLLRLFPIHINHRELHGIVPPVMHRLTDLCQFITSDMDSDESSEYDSNESSEEDSDGNDDESREENSDESINEDTESSGIYVN